MGGSQRGNYGARLRLAGTQPTTLGLGLPARTLRMNHGVMGRHQFRVLI